MLREVRPDIPVLFLDTFHHFPQTLAYRDELTRTLGAEPDQPARGGAAGRAVAERRARRPAARATRSEPLFSALEGYDTWFTALRRDQSPSRANLQEVEPFRLPSGKVIQRVSPAGGVDRRGRLGVREGARHPAAAALRARLHQHRLRAVHQLPLDPNNPRSGRWQGQKLECGIHIQAK